jgi:hypothetical protein
MVVVYHCMDNSRYRSLPYSTLHYSFSTKSALHYLIFKIIFLMFDVFRELHGAPLQPLEFELDDGPAIEALLAAYPEAVLVSELPHPSEELEDKISLAQALYREGFLLIHDEASKPENEEEADDDDPF